MGYVTDQDTSKPGLRKRLGKALWRRVPILAVAIMVSAFVRAIFLFSETASRDFVAGFIYAFPWLLLSLGGLALLIWRVNVKELPTAATPEERLKEKGSRKRWVLWALGIRTPGADSEYGEKLTRYRRWSALPVAIMSIAVFVLIGLKMYFAYMAIMDTMSTFNEEAVVAQYMSGMSEGDIILGFMGNMATSVMHASPLWLQLPLLVLWLLAFVVDFIVAASLATNKRVWWRKHWGGIITAAVTVP